ncbi:MAG TPA: TIGR00725 family protein [Solirubrobacteraceae bacterium]|nr:TIGR00725 family protein [Solirubrobacteraceae bacterium]
MAAPPYIAVVGASQPKGTQERVAEEVGRGLAAAGAVVVTGGGSGVMAGACRGAQSAGGTTIGILPGLDRRAANPWVSLALPTGLGELRNGLIIRAADAVVAVGGGYGTLSEIALALRGGLGVVGVDSWPVEGMEVAESAAAAVKRALELAQAASPPPYRGPAFGAELR